MRHSCCVLSSNLRININTNSKRVIDFLRFHELNREFIPALKITDKTTKPDFTMDVEITASAEQEMKYNNGILFVRLQKASFYPPDITFALLLVLSNLYAERSQLLLHSTVVNFRDAGFLILGEQGDGKKELSWTIGKNGGHLVSCENTAVALDMDTIIVRAATDLLHLDTELISGGSHVPKNEESSHKTYLDKLALQRAGVGVDNQSTILAVFFCKIIPNSAVFYQRRLAKVDALLRIYRNSGTYNSGSNNILISAGKPFPNLETGNIRARRLALSDHMARNLPSFEIYGDPSKAIDFLEEVVKLVKP